MKSIREGGVKEDESRSGGEGGLQLVHHLRGLGLRGHARLRFRLVDAKEHLLSLLHGRLHLLGGDEVEVH